MAVGISRAAGDILDAAMPWVRRYGRALTKSQIIGDGMAARALQTARRDITVMSVKSIRIALFRALHEVWTQPASNQMGLTAAQARVSRITPGALETLLLRAIEELPFEEIAEILHVPETLGPVLFETALQELPIHTARRVLIAESDTLIAMDMAECVSDMGCRVTGVARTVVQALKLVSEDPPNLIISTLDLADNSQGSALFEQMKQDGSGIDVVITSARPERLLTGVANEPLYVINRPALSMQARGALRQALILTSA